MLPLRCCCRRCARYPSACHWTLQLAFRLPPARATYSSSSSAAAAAAAAAARFAASGLLPRASAGFEAPDPALLDTAARAIRRASACAPVLELRRPRPARNERKVEREEREEEE